MALISGFPHKIVEINYKNIGEYITYYLDNCEIEDSYNRFADYIWYIDKDCTIPVSSFSSWQALYDAGALIPFAEEGFFGAVYYGKEEPKPKKFLDIEGVQFLFDQLSLQDYPNNETLIAVINAIDESKADRADLKQSDWNQNDSNEIDYIKNRPFYSIEISEEQILVDETNIVAEEDWYGYNTNGEAVISYKTPINFKIDNIPINWSEFGTCLVEFDGEIFQSLPDNHPTIGYYIGDPSLVDSNILMWDESIGFCLCGNSLYLKDQLPHTIKISLSPKVSQEIVKIPEKYLPDSVALKEDLQAAILSLEIATKEEILERLTNLDLLPIITDETGHIMTDENDSILLV